MEGKQKPKPKQAEYKPTNQGSDREDGQGYVDTVPDGDPFFISIFDEEDDE